MEEVTADGQSDEVAEPLLDILAYPLDNSVPLSAVRSAAGEVVPIKMIPSLRLAVCSLCQYNIGRQSRSRILFDVCCF
jgi:hypothetical protein